MKAFVPQVRRACGAGVALGLALVAAGAAGQVQAPIAAPAPSQEELQGEVRGVPAAQAAGRGRQGGPLTPRAAAPIDLTGYWVSLITDDWRWRVVTPPKGDVLYLPVNEAARKVAEAWDPDRDEAAGEACRAYGAGGIMHLPGRLHISWEDDSTLKVEIDTGMQTRLFRFGNPPPPTGAPTWQGFSLARWELPGTSGGRGRGAAAPAPGPRPGSSLRVDTTHMRPGYYRRNGVPYGASARMTEWFTTVTEPDGNTYLIVTKVLEDPEYIQGAYVRSVQFKKQPDGAGWLPTPCSAR